MKTFLIPIHQCSFTKSSLNSFLSFCLCNKFSAHKPINPKTVYMRKLPEHLIPMNSHKGKEIFAEAQAEGNMECFFPLIQQFKTQYLPSTCGTTTLTVVLNALNIDPQVTWKGIWR